MKNNLLVLPLALILFGLSNKSFSQNKINNSEEVENLISKKRIFNKKYGFGYKIQIYNGKEELARKYSEQFKLEFPNTESNLVYKAPEWKVQVGNYKTKLEADKDLIIFKEKFSGIIVIPMGK
ncbi:SPOR domain-containing protein [Polaribacter sargassicola]|uniref:SPOR domain-containing protein n=1 Tax=Polaribacter sargassicola TaxID=2836891 RepID=UPI001F1EFA32|nr:SPOR domain-containing protein [Polaribacter sp. DS7-9]MCG1034814.1 SPOR domain-containing protein [Polaribacter sp. DS7-9]